MAPMRVTHQNPSDEDEPDENLREELAQIDSKLDTVISELAKVTALIVELQQDVYALSKE